VFNNLSVIYTPRPTRSIYERNVINKNFIQFTGIITLPPKGLIRVKQAGYYPGHINLLIQCSPDQKITIHAK
jgi:hypothetical protein